MRSLFSLLVLLIFVISCGKRDVRRYAGVVVDTTGSPVSQAEISIVYRQGASSFSDGDDAVRTLDVTENDGSFSFKFILRKQEYIEHFSVHSPPPKSKTVDVYEYNGSSNTNMRIVLK